MIETEIQKTAPVPAFDLGRAVRRIETEVEERWAELRRNTAGKGASSDQQCIPGTPIHIASK